MQEKDFLYNLNERINNVYSEIDDLKQGIQDSNSKMLDMCNIMKDLYEKMAQLDKQTDKQTHKGPIKTQSLENETIRQVNPTDNIYIKPLNDQISSISIGNRGVKTDRQTDQQTDENTFDRAIDTLNSLDSLKKEIRLKFKKLTPKEVLVFSTIYQLEEEIGFANYRSIANKISLTESSIRDYISRLIGKNIPIIKEKVNNKEIRLFISPKLRSIVSLQTILQLRDL